MRCRACFKESRRGEDEAPQPWTQGLLLRWGRRAGVSLGSEGAIRAGRGSGRAGRWGPLPDAAPPAAGSQVTAAPWAAPCARRPAEQPTKAFLQLGKSAGPPSPAATPSSGRPPRGGGEAGSPRLGGGFALPAARGRRAAGAGGSRPVPGGGSRSQAARTRQGGGLAPSLGPANAGPGAGKTRLFHIKVFCLSAPPPPPASPRRRPPPGLKRFCLFFAPQVDNVPVKRDARTPNIRLES